MSQQMISHHSIHRTTFHHMCWAWKEVRIVLSFSYLSQPPTPEFFTGGTSLGSSWWPSWWGGSQKRYNRDVSGCHLPPPQKKVRLWLVKPCDLVQILAPLYQWKKRADSAVGWKKSPICFFSWKVTGFLEWVQYIQRTLRNLQLMSTVSSIMLYYWGYSDTPKFVLILRLFGCVRLAGFLPRSSCSIPNVMKHLQDCDWT